MSKQAYELSIETDTVIKMVTESGKDGLPTFRLFDQIAFMRMQQNLKDSEVDDKVGVS